jgi:hypothetical protein
MDLGFGERFARAVAAKDREALLDLVDPEVDFRGLTPGRFWEAGTATAVLEIMLGTWFEPSDRIDSLESVQVGSVADRESLVYRFRIENPDGFYLVEQHAYFSVEYGRINWLRIMCSGFRPIETAQ